MSLKNASGASLIEVLLAVCMVAVVSIGLSLSFPLMTKNMAREHQETVAARLASSYLNQLTSQPYAYVDTTPAATFGGSNPTCDCRNLNFSSLPMQTIREIGIDFQLASCVNFVKPGNANSWTSQCPSIGDTRYKNILVRVTWRLGNKISSITRSSSMTRF